MAHLTAAPEPIHLASCPACGGGGSATREVAGTTRYRYLMCTSCGTGRLDPMPAHPEELYTEHYFHQGGDIAGYLDYDAEAHWHRRTAATRLDRLTRSVGPRSGRGLVDVGAATGYFLDVAREAGWPVQGVEASHWAADQARGRGHRVVGSLQEVDEDSLDAVTFFQVLEHLPDPQAALGQASDRLRPGGTVLCETWDAGSRTARLAGSHWQQLSPPSVLWLFTREGMRRSAERAGLELVGWRRTPKWVGLGTVVGQAIPSTNQGSAAGLLRGATGRVGLPYPLDDLVTAVLVKG